MSNLRTASRRGFTLVELIIALVLFAIVMGAATQAILKQQRFYRGAGELLEMRSGLRQGVSLLTSDLRSLYPAAGDVYEWSESEVAFRSITGSSVICLLPTTTKVVIPPRTLIQNNALTTWLAVPAVGDSVLIYDEGREVGNDDDAWRGYQISAVSRVNGVNTCLPTTGYTVSGDLRPSTEFTLSAPVPATVVTGAPMRFFRRVDYGLYQASDSLWYLGSSDCLPGRIPVCSPMQPVSGPYRPLAGATSSGLVLSYFDTAGVELDPAVGDVTTVAQIGLIVRGETNAPFGGAEFQRDSATFTIGLRNRN